MQGFDSMWLDVIRTLRKGQELTGWSRDKGETDLRFKIEEIGSGHVTILPRTNILRRIPKSDFDQVYAFWESYNAGRIPRGEMRQLSQNTSYIFAIFHWLRNEEKRP